jgi:hypothetical protein
MKVEIIKCEKDTYWYADKIGDFFIVEELLVGINNDVYRIKDTIRTRPRYLKKSDVKILCSEKTES